MTNLPQYLTEVQVAEMTGFAIKTLSNHRFQRKGIPYRKVGHSIRYRLADVLEYMERNSIDFDEERTDGR